MRKIFIFFLCFAQIYSFHFNFTQLFTNEEIKKIKQEEKKNLEFSFNQFPCKPLTANHPPPEDASKLRFSDIKVMMSLGDSMTAGFGMVNKIFILIFLTERSTFC
jgi:hypothetical protein